MRRPLVYALSGFALFAGCAVYRSAPIEWEGESARWQDGPTNVCLSVAEIQTGAVAFSPELNALRLAHATARAKALASGYWQDPSLDFDYLRILRSSESPNIFGASLSLTIPLSGIPGLESKAAEAYARADWWTLVAAERATVSEAARLAITARELDRLTTRMADALSSEDCRAARQTVEKLVGIGELQPTERRALRTTERDLRQSLTDLAHEKAAAETELRRLLQLPPSCTFDWTCEETVPTAPTNQFVALDFIRAPTVRANLARLEGGENELQIEIRRQYPELTLGPAFSQEDGLNRIGPTASLSLPLWNRNRLGIATATGARDAARLEAVETWKSAVREWYSLKIEERNFHAENPFQHEVSPGSDKSAELHAIGEIAANDYLAFLYQELAGEVVHARRKIDYAIMVTRLEAIRDGLTLTLPSQKE